MAAYLKKKKMKTAGIGAEIGIRALGTVTDAAIGAGIGAGIGALLNSENRGAGARHGALVGGGAALAGNFGGNALDLAGASRAVSQGGTIGAAIGGGIGLHRALKDKFKTEK